MSSSSTTKRKIVVYGRGYQPRFFEFVASLTGKEIPRLCYLPTASGDNEQGIINWYEACAKFKVQPFYQKMFISSYDQQQTFEEVLLSMDGIIVGGGNTLNMMAIWNAQGVDVILKKAWDQGIVLAGGSAGSLCWFEEGTTDSRPKQLSKVNGLGFIKGSHCPHTMQNLDAGHYTINISRTVCSNLGAPLTTMQRFISKTMKSGK